VRGIDGWRVAVLAVCLLTGLLFGVSRSSADGYDLRGGRTMELSGLVRAAEARVVAAQTELTGLNGQLRDRERVAAGSDRRIAEVTARAQLLEPAVGLSPFVGPGLVVTLTDAPRGPDGRYPEGVEPDALVVHQQDVQSVINGLWAGGAEALAVQDQRLINTSAVRCIGNTLLLGGRTYSPPFVITAIGDPVRLRAGLDEADGVRLYRQYAQAYGLGYEVRAPRTVSVPVYTGSLRLVSAQEVMR
jgi:uncharacterized protein YlxW (UPF0749 family)